MEPALIEKPQTTLVGFNFFGNPFATSAGWTEENEIGRLWKRFGVYWDKHREQIKHVVTDGSMYEVHIEHAETKQTGEYEIFVGVAVDALEDVPVEMTIKIFPAVTYAVFTLHGKEITSDWTKMISAWMSRAGYSNPYTYGLQHYDERFKGVQNIEESILDVYVPVKRNS